jgi:hypothetical protein
MKRTIAAAILLAGALLVSAPASADYTVYRPIDVCLFSWCAQTSYTHTYTTHDDWSCIEQFGGGCDCNGSSQCYWSDHGNAGSSCPNTWFSGHWSYAIQGVCHQATNNEAWYINGGSGEMWAGDNGYVGGWGLSTGVFGYWGTDGGC